MKNPLLLTAIAFLLFSTAGVSQKQKDKKIPAKYVQLPVKKLPDDYKTYSVRVYGSSLSAANLSDLSQEKRIGMDGFKRLEGTYQSFGHIRVMVNTGWVRGGRGNFKSKTTTKKDKEGKETKTTSYWYEIPFSANTSYKILDPKGELLYSDSFQKSETRSTTSYSSSKKLRDNYSNLYNSEKRDFAKSVVSGVVSSAQSVLAKRFDYNYKTDYTDLYLIKKYSSEKDFLKYYELCNNYFKAAKHPIDVSAAREELSSALDFYKNEASEDMIGDKKLMRVYEAANYNYALLSFYLDDFASTETYAQKVIDANDGKHRRSENLIKKVDKYKKRMEEHGISTMHHVRDVANAMGPKEVSAFEEEKEELEKDNDTTDGMIVVNGQEVKGSFMMDKEAESIVFGENGNVKFMVEGDGEMKEYDLTKQEITVLSFGDRKFIKTKFVPRAKGKSDEGFHILEEVYVSDKIRLYQYYPSTGKLGDNPTEFAFQKATDTAPLSLNDTQFLLLDKGLGKYFAECPDLKEMCEGGGIKLNKDDLLKAARVYSELCEG